MLIPGYAEGSDITLMNTIYNYPRRDEEGKYDNGSLIVVYKDNVTNKKGKLEIENPDFLCYRATDTTLDYIPLFVPKDETEEHLFKFKDLDREVAKLTNQEKEYKNNLQCGNRSANKKLHVTPGANMLMSDMHIEDNFRFRFSKEYPNNVIPITKSYLDIEVDAITADPAEPVGAFKGKYPINAVSIIIEQENTVYTLLLRNKENPLIQEFENSINGNLFRELREFVIDATGGPENAAKFGTDKLNFKFSFYDEEDEILLIHDIFKLINLYQPDFVMAWNMAFDIPYIIDRIKILGYDPAEIMSHPDFRIKKGDYYVDNYHLNELEARGDFGIISSYSIFIDQLIQFASRRKGQGKMKLSLDNVGSMMVGVKKLDYSHITTRIAELPYKDYKTFVFYNIMDTIVQKCIESKAGDIDYIFGKALINNTRYEKVHRQTTYLTNRIAAEFEKDGYVLGNNVNRLKPKAEDLPADAEEDEGYAGAFVADPQLLSDYAKMKVNGIPTMLFELLDDYDYKSLYPSILMEFNIAHNTMVGRVMLSEMIYAKENPYKSEDFNRGGAFLEDYQSGNLIEFCTRWLHLADYKELYKEILYYCTNIEFVKPKSYDTRTGLLIPFYEVPAGTLRKPFVIRDRLIAPFVEYQKPTFIKENVKI